MESAITEKALEQLVKCEVDQTSSLFAGNCPSVPVMRLSSLRRSLGHLGLIHYLAAVAAVLSTLAITLPGQTPVIPGKVDVPHGALKIE